MTVDPSNLIGYVLIGGGCLGLVAYGARTQWRTFTAWRAKKRPTIGGSDAPAPDGTAAYIEMIQENSPSADASTQIEYAMQELTCFAINQEERMRLECPIPKATS